MKIYSALDNIFIDSARTVIPPDGGYYHVAPLDQHNNIAAHGIDWTRGQSEYSGQNLPPGNYFFDNRAHARMYQRTRNFPSEMWSIDPAHLKKDHSMERDPLYDPASGAGSSSYRTMSPIKPEHLTSLGTS